MTRRVLRPAAADDRAKVIDCGKLYLHRSIKVWIISAPLAIARTSPALLRKPARKLCKATNRRLYKTQTVSPKGRARRAHGAAAHPFSEDEWAWQRFRH